jgi:hypothetical protein
MLRHLIGATMALAAAVPGCAPGSEAVPAARPAQIIHIGEDFNAPFNAEAGDTIIVTMNPGDDWIARCNDMGGEPISNPFTNLNECDGVDF